MEESIPLVVHQVNLELPVVEVGIVVVIIAIMVTHKIVEVLVDVSGGVGGIHGEPHQVIQVVIGAFACSVRQSRNDFSGVTP